MRVLAPVTDAFGDGGIARHNRAADALRAIGLAGRPGRDVARDALGDGARGVRVEPRPGAGAVVPALAAARPDPASVRDAVQTRFGKSVLQSRLADLVGRPHRGTPPRR